MIRNYLLVCSIILITLECLLSCPVKAQSAAWMAPLGGRLLLSGNFGELRATHFHSGVDFRTGGREGVPVLSPADGIVARIRVASGGYGQALYVEHADGTTTVYGHLQRYNKKITNFIREVQYRKESFEIDEDTRACGLAFKRGDTLAFTGNTGSSGGPHLHFEIRNTQTEKVMNPLHIYPVKDLLAPRIKGIYFYRISPLGEVRMLRKGVLQAQGSGRYTCGTVTVPAGKVGVGVFAEDYINDSANKLGVYRLVMRVNGTEIFRLQVDTCSFEQAMLINELKDFKPYKRQETVYKCFGNHLHQIAGVCIRNKGEIEVKKDSTVAVEIIVSDIAGNKSSLKFTLVGKGAAPETGGDAELLIYNKKYTLEIPGYRLDLDSNSLFSTIKCVCKIVHDTTTRREVLVLAEEETPLAKSARLSIGGKFSDKAVICKMEGRLGRSARTTFRDSSGIYCFINQLSGYTVVEDHVAPVISYLGVSPDRKMKFKIKDQLSGVATYRGEVNGKWCLFVYDAKSDLLYASLDEPVFSRGRQNDVRLMVEDAVGNRTEVRVTVKS